ncbi:hypothetical protein ABB02_00329 [Clostridiaceae bacterium JG1575]|nr:hypothetical protein ABB02_00329 [Clostridiaceae bacterium JG1575]
MIFILDVRGLHKTYGKKRVLEEVSFQLERGSVTGLIGVNGSGKSTLLRILAGAEKPTSGAFLIQGQVMKRARSAARFVAYVPQENALIEELTVLDNLKLWYADALVPLSQALDRGLLKEMGIRDFLKTRVKNCSGGMKKRLAIACSLAHEAPILLLDEPGASLDLLMKKELTDAILLYARQGGTVLWASHDPEELGACSKGLLLKRGRIEPLEGIPSSTELLQRLSQ